MFFRLKRFLPFILAGIFATAAVIVLRRYITGERKTLADLRKKLESEFQNPVEVIVARKDILEEELVTPAHLDRVLIPPKFVQPYATPRAADIVGMRARVPIAKGEQVLVNKLATSDRPTASTLAGLTPGGKRAITIGTDVLTAVGGFIKPGDQVDVLWTFQAPSPDGKGQGGLVTMTLFQDAQVLAVDTRMVGQEKTEPPGQGSADGAGSVATVTLALTPQETELLLFAREQGQIALTLRSAIEKEGVLALSPANLNTVLELLFGAPPPSAPVSEPHTVEVFKGLDRNLVTVN